VYGPLQVLIVEDQPSDAELMIHELRTAGFDPIVRRVDNEQDYVSGLLELPDIILADYHLPQFDAFRALRILRARRLDIPLIIVSGSIGEDFAVTGIKEGASDYLLKDRMARLGQAVTQALEQRRLRAENRETGTALLESEERYRELFENANDVIYIRDLKGFFTAVNKAAVRLTGYSRRELLGMNIADILPPEFVHFVEESNSQSVERGSISSEFEIFAKDGRRVPMEVSTQLVLQSGEPVGVQAIARDITERRRAEAEIAFLAYHDKLTGLPNRAKFEEIVELSLARARRKGLAVAVLCADLDNLKLVNDSLGHGGGDDLLRQVGRRLIQISRETDVVARLGGDEFLIVLADLEMGRTELGGQGDKARLAAESLAGRIHEVLREPFKIGDGEYFVSTSIGVSLFPQDADDVASLLKNADAAMYRSKKAAPGGYSVFRAGSSDGSSTLSLATRLHRAADDRSWSLYYQPIVDLKDGRMSGVEALLRWNDAEYGMVPAADFIPLAEEMGLMSVIGEWVLEELFRQCTIWRDQGLVMDLSFNLSPRQLWHPHLAPKLLARLDHWGVDPRRLIVEVTETATMADPDRIERVLLKLRQRGVRIAIDDFGTGHSSLSRLRHLPVDILKIDRSFVHDIPDDAGTCAMVRTIIDLAGNLGLSTVAEGVETEEHRRFLVGHGCMLGQGFLFSPAVPAHEIDAMVGRSLTPSRVMVSASARHP
jgi:diguanylate cyclase (GGDEF)-like protein/PAS domain S-box-containing protein